MQPGELVLRLKVSWKQINDKSLQVKNFSPLHENFENRDTQATWSSVYAYSKFNQMHVLDGRKLPYSITITKTTE